MNESGNNSWRCSAKNANTLPGGTSSRPAPPRPTTPIRPRILAPQHHHTPHGTQPSDTTSVGRVIQRLPRQRAGRRGRPMTMRPCIDCGEPTASTRCPEHRGYDSDWDRLSRKARKLQRFCSDCGSTEDLQTDHSPDAWARKAAGKPIRLRDVDVVCGPCNRVRGQARPESLQHSASRGYRSLENRCDTTSTGGGMTPREAKPRRASRGARYTPGVRAC